MSQPEITDRCDAGVLRPSQMVQRLAVDEDPHGSLLTRAGSSGTGLVECVAPAGDFDAGFLQCLLERHEGALELACPHPTDPITVLQRRPVIEGGEDPLSEALLFHAKAMCPRNDEESAALIELGLETLEHADGEVVRSKLLLGLSRLTYSVNAQRHHQVRIIHFAETASRDAASLEARAAAEQALTLAAWSAQQVERFPDLTERLRSTSEECQAQGLSCIATAKLDNTLGSLEASRGHYASAAQAFIVCDRDFKAPRKRMVPRDFSAKRRCAPPIDAPRGAVSPPL